MSPGHRLIGNNGTVRPRLHICPFSSTIEEEHSATEDEHDIFQVYPPMDSLSLPMPSFCGATVDDEGFLPSVGWPINNELVAAEPVVM